MDRSVCGRWVVVSVATWMACSASPTLQEGGQAAAGKTDRADPVALSSAQWVQDPQAPYPGRIRAVWGTGPENVYVVGEQWFVAHRVRQGQWQTQSMSDGNWGDLTSIWGSGADDIYAVGDGALGSPGIILHSTGHGDWDLTQGTEGTGFTGVWGTGPKNVYLIGEHGLILHSVGDGGWPVEPTELNEALGSIWGAGASDVYVAGWNGLLLRSAGDGQWSKSASLGEELESVDGLWGDGQALWAITGRYYRKGGRVKRRSGSQAQWSTLTTETSNLHAVWGAPSGDVYAVGDDGLLLHFTPDGSRTREASGTTADLYHIWGSSERDIYVVGSDGTLLHKGNR